MCGVQAGLLQYSIFHYRSISFLFGMAMDPGSRVTTKVTMDLTTIKDTTS